jgi:antitoxin component YwqK of YwqJK toxin-antitoxin module
MNRLVNTLVIFFVVIMPLNSQEFERQKNYTDENGLRQGYWERKYPNGNFQYRGTFKDNRPRGEFIRFFPDGNKMAVMHFCDKGIRAEAKLYYENGNVAATGVYVNEEKDSVWQYFSYYGNHLAGIETYDNGVKEGVSAVYYENGKPAETFWYERDMKNGPWRQFYDNGALKVEAEFVDDQRHGKFNYYTPGGRIEMEGQYFRDQMHGEWIYYNGNGSQVSVINYINGRPENETELMEKEQEMFRQIEEMRGRIPEPDESEMFSPQ